MVQSDISQMDIEVMWTTRKHFKGVYKKISYLHYG